jgi:hypothetical protein
VKKANIESRRKKMSQSQIETDKETSYKTPTWVKILGIITLVLVILVAILMQGGHNPGLHNMPSADTSLSAEVTEVGE